MRYILFLIAIFIHVDNVAVGPTCFFSFFPFFFNTSKNFNVVFSFFLSFFHSKRITININFGRLIQHQHEINFSFNTPTFRH